MLMKLIGEPDIEGIPAGNDDDGVNYVYTLRDLKEALTEDVSLSFAAPASYWYLKQFEIESMSTVVDYIVYMTCKPPNPVMYKAQLDRTNLVR